MFSYAARRSARHVSRSRRASNELDQAGRDCAWAKTSSPKHSRITFPIRPLSFWSDVLLRRSVVNLFQDGTSSEGSTLLRILSDSNGNGVRRRTNFRSHDEASKAISAYLNKSKVSGDFWARLTTPDRRMIVATLEEMKAEGVTVRSVWEDWRHSGEKTTCSQAPRRWPSRPPSPSGSAEKNSLARRPGLSGMRHQ